MKNIEEINNLREINLEEIYNKQCPKLAYCLVCHDFTPLAVLNCDLTTAKGDITKLNDSLTGLSDTVAIKVYSYQPSANNINELFEAVRYTSGCCGSVDFTNETHCDNTWYWFIYIPHRSGGKNGEADGDNCDHGCLLLFQFWSDNIYRWIYNGNTKRMQKISYTSISL